MCDLYMYSWERLPPSGQPESLTDASQVGESHECLEVLQQGAFKAQKTDEGAHHLIDLTTKSETRLSRKFFWVFFSN